MVEKTKEQVIAQLRVVAHLAKQIAAVHNESAEIYAGLNMTPGLIDIIGNRTAYAMEILGDILNGMDAVEDDEDGWTYPIFETAQKLWPQKES